MAACAVAAGLGVGAALAASGGLDPSFGTGGTTVLERPTETYPTPTALAAGGKIVVVSTSIPGGIAVSRRLPNGAPDPTFNGGEYAVIEEPGAVPSAYALALQPDGKIVLVGFRNEMNGGKAEEAAMVWRLKADGGSGAPHGALDPTFGKKGLLPIKTFTATVGAAVAIQPDGKIVVTGTGFNTGDPHNTVAVWRLTADGTFDEGFGTKGTVGFSDGHSDSVKAIALQTDGKIVLAGTTNGSPNPEDAVVWRLKANGGSGEGGGPLDTTFNTSGQANIDSGGSDVAASVALQADGKIVVAGYATGGLLGNDAIVWRLNANGGAGSTNSSLDSTFGNGGAAAIGGAGVFARAAALELQPDGKILAAGSTQMGANPFAAVIWRLLAGGGTAAVNSALDPTFGTGGATTVTSGSFAEASAIALQPDRRIIASGSTGSGLGSHLFLFRALGDPFAVNVAKAGTGSGSVQSAPPGIGCGAACSGSFEDGSEVTLTATPAPGSAFAGWSGAGCAGAGSCALTMSADRTVTATFNAVPPAPPPPVPPTKATISALGESNSSFTVGPSSTPLTGQTSAKRHKRGTVFSFRLDQAATVKIAIQKKVPGRRVARSCRAESRRLRHKPRCTRTIKIATLIRSGRPGLNKVPFSGRIRASALPPGRYQVTFTAVDGAGASPPKTLSFTILAR